MEIYIIIQISFSGKTGASVKPRSICHMVTNDTHSPFWHSHHPFTHLLLSVQFPLAFEFAILDLSNSRQFNICSLTLYTPIYPILLRKMRVRKIIQLIQSPSKPVAESGLLPDSLIQKYRAYIYILHCHISKKGLKILLNQSSVHQNFNELHLSSCTWVIGEKGKKTNNKGSSKVYDML